MRLLSLSLSLVLLCQALGCGGRRRGGGDDDDDTSDGGPDGDADVDGDADGDPCATPDRDQDGHEALLCGGDDCDDLDPTAHPGATETTTWSARVVWPSTVYYPAVTVDESGIGYAAFTIYDANTGRASLGYASNIGGSWVGTEIVAGQSTGWMPAIAVDANGDAHIVYYESASTTTVSYVHQQDGEWVTRSLGDGYGQAITVDAEGHVFIAFTRYVNGQAALAVASDVSGNWVTATIDDTSSSTGYYPEIAVDSQGHVHVAYEDFSSSYVVRYATNAGGGWELQQVGNGGGDFLGLVIDAGDEPHVVYAGWDVNGSPIGVRHATREIGGWASEVIDATGMYPDVAIDRSDALHVVYTDSSYTSVRYASDRTGAWTTEVLASGASAYYYPDVALGGGELLVLYQDAGLSESGRSAPDGLDQDCNGVPW